MDELRPGGGAIDGQGTTDARARLALEDALGGHVAEKEWSQAGRIAVKLERYEEAAGYFLDAQQPYEAAVCFHRASLLDKCLEALLLVPFESARYRPACIQAIRVAIELPGQPVGRLSKLVVPFINSRPKSPAEATAFVNLAGALARSKKVGLAHALYKRVLGVYPEDPTAKEGLEADSAEGGIGGVSAAPLPEGPPTPAGEVAPAPQGSQTRPLSARNPQVRARRLGQLLIERGRLTPTRLTQVLSDQPTVGTSDLLLWDALVGVGFATDLDVIQALSADSGIPFISEEKLLQTNAPDAVKALPVELAERWRVAPLTLVGRHLTIAMRDPRDMTLIDQIKFGTGLRHVEGVFASELSIRRGIRKFYFGEDQEASQDDWRGMVLEPVQANLTAFSDRFTKTREREYDTGSLELLGTSRASEGAGSSQGGGQKTKVLGSADVADVHIPEVGTLFAGRYQLEALVGKGGMATVFRAHDMELSEPVAMKLFRPVAWGEEMLDRFKLEVSLSRKLNHPNITRLYDLGAFEGWRYLTMELLEGTDLADLIITRGEALPIVEGLGYLEQACEGLQVAHDRGVIHRDIKPANLFITNEGRVKLMDFGIAKKEGAPSVTMAGMVVGTPEFMSPEQTRGAGGVTHLTDLYSLGATAYAMFTGAPPFVSPEFMAVLMAHVNQKPASPREKNPGIPVEVEGLILRLLEKDPARRYASCLELKAHLGDIRQAIERSTTA